MSNHASVPTVDLGFTLEFVEPYARIAREEDIASLDRHLELQLSIIGRVCAVALVAVVGFVFLAIFFKSPLALIGVVGMLALVAATLRVGELQHKRYVVARRFGVAQDHDFPGS